MLANLLPGFRDLRTPLITGYMWLFVLWLVVQPEIPDSRPADDFNARVWDLVHLVGRPGCLAAVSVVAFLLGALFQVGPKVLTWPGWVSGSRLRRWTGEDQKPTVAAWVDEQLAPFSHARGWSQPIRRSSALPLALTRGVDEHSHDFGALGSEEVDAQIDRAFESVLADCVWAERESLTTRLQLEREPVFNDYDRLSAEGSFRGSVAIPLAAAILILAYVQSSWFVVVLAAPLMLAFQAVSKQQAADAKLWGALVGGYISSPVTDRVLTLLESVSDTAETLSDLELSQRNERRGLIDSWRAMLIEATKGLNSDRADAVKLASHSAYPSLSGLLPAALREELENGLGISPDRGSWPHPYTNYAELRAVSERIGIIEEDWFPSD